MPVPSGDRGDAARGSDLGGTQDQNDVGASPIAQRSDRGVQPTINEYLRLAVSAPGARGQKDPDVAWPRICRLR